jgi:1-aminocyclopropane-1-carboxylate deaminase/D-cysteine desulfhydrase-like pyridoxal-dependent ACC family enzyme
MAATMFETGLTPCQHFEFYAKREDLACFQDEATPSGAKVRQYAAMVARAPDNAVLAVGCSAASAMQVYVAALGEQLQRPAYIAVPRRKQRHPCTEWCVKHGAIIIETVPGYPSVFRARIRERMKELGLIAVRWNVRAAALDTAEQVANVPPDARRIVVPNGSGLTAAGIIGGLWQLGRQDVEVHLISTHDTVGTRAQVLKLVLKYFGEEAVKQARVSWRAQTMPYQRAVHNVRLADGMLLDPFYAAKAACYCLAEDVLWITGRRPLASCQ